MSRRRFVDIDSRTYNLDPEKIEAAITPRTRAIMTADTFGQPADYDRIQEIAVRHGVALILDAGHPSAPNTNGGAPARTGWPRYSASWPAAR